VLLGSRERADSGSRYQALFAPARRPQLVARPRLVEQLDTTLEAGHRLSLVSAPAGFGKTILLSDWLTHLDPS
jgi:LuxR family maltose regulon positive regulatory protein